MYGVLEAISIQGGKGEYWIGGQKSDVSVSFVWDSDSSIVDGDNWAHGFPMSGRRFFSLLVLVYEVTMCMYRTSGSSSTCIQQSAPEGFFRDQDCRQLNFFVCEILAGNGFSEPPEGTHIIFLKGN